MRCRMSCIMGPAMAITFGVLFLLDNLHVPGAGFGRTWPVILLVVGLVKVLQSNASTEGHIERTPTPPPQIIPPSAVTPDDRVQHG